MAQSGADAVRDIFGDVFSESEDDPRSPRSAGKQRTPAAEELFGDFDSGDDEPAQGQGSSRAAPGSGNSLKRLKRANTEESDHESVRSSSTKKKAKVEERPKVKERKKSRKDDKQKLRSDISRFYDTEAQEGAGSDDEDGSDLEGLLDDTEVPEQHSGRDAHRQHMQMQQSRQDLEQLQQEMAARGDRQGSRSFGSFLNKLEEKYKVMEEDDEGTDPGRGHVQSRHPERGHLERGDTSQVHLPLGQGKTRATHVAPPSPVDSIGEELEPDQPDQRDTEIKERTNAYVVPDAKDPKLWCVKTFAPEKELCLSLLLKCGEHFAAGKPVPIFSVFYSEHLRGYIYVEAHKEAEIRNFSRGIRGISQWNIKIVPNNQMPQVFVASAANAEEKEFIRAGDWIRMKRGPYKGDLGQVDEVKDDMYVVKIKPRLDILGASKGNHKDDKKHRQRPAARWFNLADLESGGIIVNTDKRFTSKGFITFFMVDGNLYRDGFHYKTLKSSYFASGAAVKPQEHEIQDWKFVPPIDENTRPSADLEKVDDKKLMPPPSAVPKRNAVMNRVNLVDDDVVIVIAGDLRNLRGKVTKAVTGADHVLVKPFGVDNLKGELSLSQTVLSKFFEVGDHVKAVAGDNEGDAGYIVKVHLGGTWGFNTMATVLSDTMRSEFKVRTNHLRLTLDKATDQENHGEFSCAQLVRVGGSVGLITRIEAGSRAIVLNTEGTRACVEFGEMEPVVIPQKNIYAKTWTLDRKGQQIHPGSVVKAPQSNTRALPVRAMVLFIHKSFVFLQATESLVGDRAFMVCDGRKCEFVWTKKEPEKVKPKVDVLPAVPAKAGAVSYGVVMSSQTSWAPGWFQKLIGVDADPKSGALAQKGTGVRIVGGSYKGLRGEVRDHQGDKVLIALLSVNKLVLAPLAFVAPDDFAKPRLKHNRAAPSTPKLTTMAAQTPQPKDVQVDGAAGTPVKEHVNPPSPDDDDALLPTEADAWNPNYMTKTAEESAVNRDVVKIGTPMKVVPKRFEKHDEFSPADHGGSDTDETSSAHNVTLPTRKRRRQSRLPTPGAMLDVDSSPRDFTSPVCHSPTSEERLTSQSPSELFLRSVPFDGNREVSRTPWLMVGLGVRYLRDGKDSGGWILKVYADTAHVVPETAQVGDDSIILPLKGSDIRPWECSKRGEIAGVFDGPRRGSKGKIIGFEGNKAYIRNENQEKGVGFMLFSMASGDGDIVADSKDIALYSREWETHVNKTAKDGTVGISVAASPGQVATPKRPLNKDADNFWAPAWDSSMADDPHDGPTKSSPLREVDSLGNSTPAMSRGEPTSPRNAPRNPGIFPEDTPELPPSETPMDSQKETPTVSADVTPRPVGGTSDAVSPPISETRTEPTVDATISAEAAPVTHSSVNHIFEAAVPSSTFSTFPLTAGSTPLMSGVNDTLEDTFTLLDPVSPQSPPMVLNTDAFSVATPVVPGEETPTLPPEVTPSSSTLFTEVTSAYLGGNDTPSATLDSVTPLLLMETQTPMFHETAPTSPNTEWAHLPPSPLVSPEMALCPGLPSLLEDVSMPEP